MTDRSSIPPSSARCAPAVDPAESSRNFSVTSTNFTPSHSSVSPTKLSTPIVDSRDSTLAGQAAIKALRADPTDPKAVHIGDFETRIATVRAQFKDASVTENAKTVAKDVASYSLGIAMAVMAGPFAPLVLLGMAGGIAYRHFSSYKEYRTACWAQYDPNRLKAFVSDSVDNINVTEKITDVKGDRRSLTPAEINKLKTLNTEFDEAVKSGNIDKQIEILKFLDGIGQYVNLDKCVTDADLGVAHPAPSDQSRSRAASVAGQVPPPPQTLKTPLIELQERLDTFHAGLADDIRDAALQQYQSGQKADTNHPGVNTMIDAANGYSKQVILRIEDTRKLLAQVVQRGDDYTEEEARNLATQTDTTIAWMEHQSWPDFVNNEAWKKTLQEQREINQKAKEAQKEAIRDDGDTDSSVSSFQSRSRQSSVSELYDDSSDDELEDSDEDSPPGSPVVSHKSFAAAAAPAPKNSSPQEIDTMFTAISDDNAKMKSGTLSAADFVRHTQSLFDLRDSMTDEQKKRLSKRITDSHLTSGPLSDEFTKTADGKLFAEQWRWAQEQKQLPHPTPPPQGEEG